MEKELLTPWGENDCLRNSLLTWRDMVGGFFRELKQLRGNSPDFLENLVYVKIVASRLRGFGESLVEQLECRVGTVSHGLGEILQFYKKKQAVVGKLQSLSENSFLSLSLVEEIEEKMTYLSTCSSEVALKECQQNWVDPLCEKCEHFLKGQREYYDDFQSYLKDYKTLLETLGLEYQELPSGKEDIDFLKKQIVLLAEKITPILEPKLVRQRMNEVMLQKGFPCVGVREKKSEGSQSFVEDLYLYRPGVAVSILVRWDGKIILVLGGIAKVNREVSLEETQSIRGYMLSFLDNISDIQSELLRKGVVLEDSAWDSLSSDEAILVNQNEFQCQKELENFGNYFKREGLNQKKGSGGHGGSERA